MLDEYNEVITFRVVALDKIVRLVKPRIVNYIVHAWVRSEKLLNCIYAWVKRKKTKTQETNPQLRGMMIWCRVNAVILLLTCPSRSTSFQAFQLTNFTVCSFLFADCIYLSPSFSFSQYPIYSLIGASSAHSYPISLSIAPCQQTPPLLLSTLRLSQ